jgi:hypothetical protein
MTVDTKTVRELWDLPYEGNPDEDVEVIENNITGNTRWDIQMELIVRIKDKFYTTGWSKGATESQWHEPWEDDEVEFTEVRKVEKMVTVWEEVE